MTAAPPPRPAVRIPPRYCRCGRALVWRETTHGFDCYTGRPSVKRDLVCPRFSPQWRNLWFGGLKHDGWWGDETGLVGTYEWR